MARPFALLCLCLCFTSCNCFRPVSECGHEPCDGGGGGGGGGGTGGGTPASDAGVCSGCLGVELNWGMNGGLTAYDESSKLTPCRHYTHQRQTYAVPPMTTKCEADVAFCPNPTIAELDTALADPAVQAALKNHTLFGTDPRPVDGQVLEISSGTGFFDVGSCASGNCGVTGALKTLVDGVRALDADQLGREPCKSQFP